MKKIYSTLAIAIFSFGANAQQNIVKTFTPRQASDVILNNGALPKTTTTATLMPATFSTGGCATNSANIVYYSNWSNASNTQYTVVAQGYSFGTNFTSYTITGVGVVTDVANRAAQKYNVTGNVTVTDVLVATGIAQGTGTVSAKIYSEDITTKGPSAQIGTTASKVLNTFTGYDAITFGTPVALTAGNFFASIESPAMGGSGMDTLAILSTVGGCSSTDSLSWTFDVVTPPIFAAGWKSVNSAFGVNLDLMIFPVVDISTGLNNSISKGNLTLLAAFPNPTANEITINFGLNQNNNVEIEMYDVTGKNVKIIKLDNLNAGNHSSKINVSDLNAGVYMYSVKCENVKMYSKFTVTK